MLQWAIYDATVPGEQARISQWYDDKEVAQRKLDAIIDEEGEDSRPQPYLIGRRADLIGGDNGG